MVTTDTTTKTGWRQYVKIHPACDALPLMPPDQLRELADDIERHGLRNSVQVLWGHGPDGLTLSPKTSELIDGRNRLDAWELLQRPVIDPATGDWDSEFREHVGSTQPMGSAADVVVAEVISQNLRRRHLSEPERVGLALAVVKAMQKVGADTGEASSVSSNGRGGRGHVGVVAKVAKMAKVHKNTARKHLAASGIPVPKRPPTITTVTAPTITTATAPTVEIQVKKPAKTWDGRLHEERLRDCIAAQSMYWPKEKKGILAAVLREIAKEIERGGR